MPIRDIPFSAKLFTNVRETVLTKASAAVENAYTNEADGISRFPGLASFATLVGGAPTYLHDWQNDLIAVTSGRVYRINSQGVATDVTGAPVAGDLRAVFAKTDTELTITAGKEIVRLSEAQTQLLSPDAPLATHVAYVDGYLLANERDTGAFFHSEANETRTWNPLDTFAASGKPDAVDSIVVTPFREVIVGGAESVEQFERLPSGTVPFFRRWSVSEGIKAPYTMVAADNAVWYVNDDAEFARATGQIGQPVSDDIGRTLEGVDNWTGAWAAKMHLVGQKFIVLQMPLATNIYGTPGITAVLDYRRSRWFNLYGWQGGPVRWPGWSYHKLWGRHFVGGNGCVYELRDDAYQNAGAPQRAYGRTAHFDQFGRSRVNNVRVRVANVNWTETQAKFQLRATRDNRRQTRWVERSLPRVGAEGMTIDFGPMGDADGTWQFEWQVTDACQFELVKMQADVTGLGH